MSRYFAFTLDNYTEEEEARIQAFAKDKRVLHLIYGREKAPTTGMLHLQGAFCLKNKAKRTTMKNYIGINKLHLEQCLKVYEANINYCKKDGDVWQWPHEFLREDKIEQKQTYAQAIELAKQGKFDEIRAELILKYDTKLKKIFIENMDCCTTYLDNKYGNFFPYFNLFMYGKTGTGKSFRVNEIIFVLNQFWKVYCKARGLDYKPLRCYRKLRNKWWDDYLGEEIIAIEELEPNWVNCSSSNLKTWMDQYPFQVEVKGSSIKAIRPMFFLITSNYTLEKLCTKDGELIEEDYWAIRRRMLTVNIKSDKQDIDWPRLDKIALYYDTIKEVKISIYEEHMSTFNKRMLKFQAYEEERQNKEKGKGNSINKKQLEKYCKLINILIPGFLEPATEEENVSIIEPESHRECDIQEVPETIIIDSDDEGTSNEQIPRLGKHGIDWVYYEEVDEFGPKPKRNVSDAGCSHQKTNKINRRC